MTKIEDLQLQVKEFIDERDWSQFHNLKDLAISLQLESSEVLEHFQWETNDETLSKLKNTSARKMIGEELADVLYWTVLMANKLDLDLAKAFNNKMQINREKYPKEKARNNHKKYTEL